MIQSEFGLPDGTYDLKIGKSFSKASKNRPEYHTLRYDFKPKSVSTDQEAYVATGSNDDVHIAFANDTADNLTIYKGASKPLKDGKECLLIFDEDRNEMRLEKVVSNLNVKQTRGAADEAENAIRGQIEKIRRNRKPAKRQNDSPALKLSPVKPAPVKVMPVKSPPPTENPNSHDSIREQLFAEMSSSDESDSEEEGEIVDDTQEKISKKPSPNIRSPKKKSESKGYSFSLDSSSDSASSSSSSGDEFAAELEKKLNQPPTPELTTNNDEDMPDLMNQKTPPINEKPLSSSFTKLQPLLANDLDLSDSSEDDD